MEDSYQSGMVYQALHMRYLPDLPKYKYCVAVVHPFTSQVTCYSVLLILNRLSGASQGERVFVQASIHE